MEIWNRYKNSIKKLLVVIFIFVFIYLSLTYLLPFFAPFVIALIVSYINEPVIQLLSKMKIPRKVGAGISLLVTMSALGSLITAGILKLIDELTVLQENLNTYSSDISLQLNHLVSKATKFYNDLPTEVTDTVTKNLSAFSSKITALITAILQYAISTVSSIPTITVFIIVTILATYFISSDRRRIYAFIFRQLSPKWRTNLSILKNGTFKAVIGYFRAILILMGFTFIEVSVGLFVLDINYALLMGLIVGIAEVIPIVGTGIVMIPWITWHLVNGNMQMVFGLAIIYILGILIRQIMEPKIIGSQIGLHPLATLLSMYIGLEFFGVIGMFIGPITIIIIKNLQESGLLRLWND